MKLIVGLGNPGDKYESTRHNLGFLVLDHLLKNLSSSKQDWSKDEKLKSEIYILNYQPKHGKEEKIILARPLTYMNNSGMAVSLIAKYYKVPPIDVWIIHDELDLPLGSMKIRFGGATAGHHGLDSVLAALNTDKFWRFRIGIGTSHHHDKIAKHKFDGQEYVLKGFGFTEKSKARSAIKRGVKAISMALEKGIESAQNQFNTK